MELSTPALLFPAISLLLLAYTNRFMVLTSVIRQLSHMEEEKNADIVERQIDSLSLRLKIIRNMQTLAVSAFMLCALSMLMTFLKLETIGAIIFGCSLLLLVGSLFFSLWEIHISTRAINIEIEEFQKKRGHKL